MPFDAEPEGRTLYVLEGAEPGGDGSPGRPLNDLLEAASREPKRLVLGKGHYARELWLSQHTVVLGACAAETSVPTGRVLGPHSSGSATRRGRFYQRLPRAARARSGVHI